MSQSFLLREYRQSTGPIFQGSDDHLIHCLDSSEASRWYQDNKDFFQEVEVTIPPNKTVKFSAPIKLDGEEDISFETSMLSDIRIDPKIRIIMNSLLKQYKYCFGGFFVQRESFYSDRMDSESMETLQLMKDVMLGYVRYSPISLEYYAGKGTKRKLVEYDWDIAEDLKGLKYSVGGKNYTTDIYGCYTKKLRKGMHPSNPYQFHGGHEYEYFRREYRLNSGSTNYLCASRWTGKTYSSLSEGSISLFKDQTFRDEVSDNRMFNVYMFTLSEKNSIEYSTQLKQFLYTLMCESYGLSKDLANQIVEWRNSEDRLVLHTKQGDRGFIIQSERAVSARGGRGQRVYLDESNYQVNFTEMSDFAVNSGAQQVHYISTISQDSKTSEFYRMRVEVLIKSKSLRPIEEIIHYLWEKYGFHKIRSRKDYVKFVKDGIFDDAKAEFYTMRPFYGQKTTIDDIDRFSEMEKQNQINKTVNSPSGYEGMLAELYCELMPETPEIKYRPNIIESKKLPRTFDRIYFGYDEAESFDDAGFVVGGIFQKKLYILEAHILNGTIEKKYEKMNEIISFWTKKSASKSSMIMDIQRGPSLFREVSKAVQCCDAAIKARNGNFEKEGFDSGIRYYSVGTDMLVTGIMNNELIAEDKVFFSDSLGGDGGLFDQFDSYIKDKKGTFKGKGSAKDDLVCACLYMAYYAFKNGIQNDIILMQNQERGAERLNVGKMHHDYISRNSRSKKSIRSHW